MTFNVISSSDIARGLIDGLYIGYKQWGETPLETLERVRQENPHLRDVPLSYAGRLDPLAEGVLLILCGEANKFRQQFLGLDKQYECEVLFGIKTDSADLLGLITEVDRVDVSAELIQNVLASLLGPQSFPYPVFSSKTIQGKPLFQWFKEGRIHEIQIPSTDILIKDISLLSCKDIYSSDVIDKIKKATELVHGDFRQKEILESYIEKIADSMSFKVAVIHVECTSGAYMRTIAEKIGETCGSPAIAYSIKRVKIGNFTFTL